MQFPTKQMLLSLPSSRNGFLLSKMNPTVNSRSFVLIKVQNISTKLLLPPIWKHRALVMKTLQPIPPHPMAQQSESIAHSLTWYAPCSTNPNYHIPSGSKPSTQLSKSEIGLLQALSLEISPHT